MLHVEFPVSFQLPCSFIVTANTAMFSNFQGLVEYIEMMTL